MAIEWEKQFNDERWSERRKFDSKIYGIDRDEDFIKDTLSKLRENALVTLEHSDVVRIDSIYHIDLYKLCAEKCKAWHRTYVKCVKVNWNRYVVVVNGNDRQRGVVTNLLMTAEAIKPKTGWSKKKAEEVEKEVDVIGAVMQSSDAPILSYVTARTVTILFQNAEGTRMYQDWMQFCLTDRMQRLYLGLPPL